MNSQIKKAWVVINKLGSIPQKKGPFFTSGDTAKMVRDLMDINIPIEHLNVIELVQGDDIWIIPAPEFLFAIEGFPTKGARKII